jgi:hypothetical protein
MAIRNERWGARNEAMSRFHREVGFYVGPERAEQLKWIDIDDAIYVDYGSKSQPIALFETCLDRGPESHAKPAWVIQALAMRCGLPLVEAWLVLYRNSNSGQWHTAIDEIRMRRLWPDTESAFGEYIMSPHDYAWELWRIHERGVSRLEHHRILSRTVALAETKALATGGPVQWKRPKQMR